MAVTASPNSAPPSIGAKAPRRTATSSAIELPTIAISSDNPVSNGS
ncbi:hypothetical protein QE385_003391 [Sphingomonas sp. SORGH_AS 950]|nr:hypothetical protein [Sphingomonas sp. SORGH_AS_0950]